MYLRFNRVIIFDIANLSAVLLLGRKMLIVT